MPHHTPLISTIAVGIGLAFILALIAQRMRLSPILGYLAAGVAVGPFTPGFVADQKLAVELAEIGVILLMFGVGLHFSVRDLLSVRAIAIPGAVGQIAVATLLGMGLAALLGWSWGAGLMFGLSLSVASTVVLLRALQERRQVETEKGRIAVGWLIVEDIAMVVTLVLVPPLAGLLGGTAVSGGAGGGLAGLFPGDSIWVTLALTGVKLGVFVAVMLVVGRKVIPWAMHYVAHTGSRELFRLSVLAIALGVAYGSASLFGVSFALGAFFAGMVLAESPLSHQAAKETLPLRDAFAVLFFVSVGMLVNPSVLVQHPFAVIATFLIIVLGKSVAAWLIVRAFGHSNSVALTISASLAQIGEFSFILIVLAVDLAIVPVVARDLIVAGSILSIVTNPLAFLAVDHFIGKEEPVKSPVPVAAVKKPPGRAILVGHGRVGSVISAALLARGVPLVVVDADENAVAPLRAKGVEAHAGACGEEAMLERLDLKSARCFIAAIPDVYEAGHLVEAAKTANPSLRVIARAHGAEEVAYLSRLGADVVLMGEEELARAMSEAVLRG